MYKWQVTRAHSAAPNYAANMSVSRVCCIKRMLTFTEQALNAVMQVLFAVKASLSRVVYATIVRVPYCVKPQGTGSIPPTQPPHPLTHPPSPLHSLSLAWKIPHEPLLWCKSQVGEMWARLMHRHCAVKSLLTLPTGDSRKIHGARAGEGEESYKEGMGAKEREMWGDVSISRSHFWLPYFLTRCLVFVSRMIDWSQWAVCFHPQRLIEICLV